MLRELGDAPYWAQTLGLIGVQAFSTDEVPVDDVSLGRVTTVLSSFPTPPAGDPAAVSAAADGATRLVGASMKWCRQCVPQNPRLCLSEEQAAADFCLLGRVIPRIRYESGAGH